MIDELSFQKLDRVCCLLCLWPTLLSFFFFFLNYSKQQLQNAKEYANTTWNQPIMSGLAPNLIHLFSRLKVVPVPEILSTPSISYLPSPRLLPLSVDVENGLEGLSLVEEEFRRRVRNLFTFLSTQIY